MFCGADSLYYYLHYFNSLNYIYPFPESSHIVQQLPLEGWLVRASEELPRPEHRDSQAP